LCTPFEDFPSPTAVPPHDGFAALLPFTPSRLTPRRPGTGFTDMATSTTAYAEVFVTGRSDALTADARHFRSPAEADASCGMHRRDIVGPPGGDRCEVSSGPPRLSTPGTGSPPHGIPSMPGHTSTGPGFPFRRADGSCGHGPSTNGSDETSSPARARDSAASSSSGSPARRSCDEAPGLPLRPVSRPPRMFPGLRRAPPALSLERARKPPAPPRPEPKFESLTRVP
jgi:hypothetical protein